MGITREISQFERHKKTHTRKRVILPEGRGVVEPDGTIVFNELGYKIKNVISSGVLEVFFFDMEGNEITRDRVNEIVESRNPSKPQPTGVEAQSISSKYFKYARKNRKYAGIQFFDEGGRALKPGETVTLSDGTRLSQPELPSGIVLKTLKELQQVKRTESQDPHK
jgi:hypothetical protein